MQFGIRTRDSFYLDRPENDLPALIRPDDRIRGFEPAQ